MEHIDRVAGRTVLLTGARGGIGAALVAAFLQAGARRVVAADRSPEPAAAVDDPRLSRCVIDLQRPETVALAAAEHPDVDILVNNAGFNGNLGIFEEEAAERAQREIEVNYLGLLHMLRAFAPRMRERGHGVIVQLLSFVALANLPAMGSYSASKAAARSLTQAARAELSPFGLNVIGVFPRVVDTAMSAHLAIPKMSAAEVAQATLEAISCGADEAFPGPAASAYAAFLADPAQVERDNGQRLPASTRALLQDRA